MPQQQILPTWLALNGGTFTSPSGLTDSRTGLPFMAGGLNVGDYFDLSEAEANNLSNTAVGTLHAGRYRFVQIDSGATLANIATGTVGLQRNITGGSYSGPENYVTTYDQANNYLTLNNLRKVVFLCPVTSGQTLASGVFAFVQELGDASVLLKAGIQNGSPAIGDLINITTTGADDPTSQSVVKATVGVATTLPASSTLCRVQLDAPVFQD